MAEQLDYLAFVHGFAWLWLAMLLWGKAHSAHPRLPWLWLAGFALLHGVREWLELAALSVGRGPGLVLVQGVLLVSALLALLEFGRRGLRAQGLHVPGGWIDLPLLALLAWKGWTGAAELEAVSRYVLGFPGALLTAWVLLREARQLGGGRRWWLRLAGTGFVIYALVGGLVPPQASFFPATVINTAVFLRAGAPVYPLQALAAIIALLGVWGTFRREPDADNPVHWFQRQVLPGLVVALLLGGYQLTNWQGQQIDAQQRELLLSRAVATARALNPERVRALTFTPADLTAPAGQRLREQLLALGSVLPARFLYTMAQRDGAIVFGPDNVAENDPQFTPPGDVYRQPPAELREVFSSGRALSTGPYTDEWGSYVSAFAPVPEPRTGAVLAVLGIDQLTTTWQALITRARLATILFILAAAVVLLAGSTLVQWRQRVARPGPLRLVEAYLTGALGLVLTLGLAWLANEREERYREELFARLGQARAGSVVTAMQDIRDHRLEGLARFFEGSQLVDREEFRVYTEPIAQTGDVQAWEWAPAVPAAAASAWEAEVRRTGSADLRIWQLDEAGQRKPAAGRETYYPVLYAEPSPDNGGILGFDLGSELVRRVALEKALETGLPTASDSVVLVQDNTREKAVLIFQPVRGGTSEAGVRGFVVAAVQLKALLRQVLAIADPRQAAVIVDLYQLSGGCSPWLLASSEPQHTASRTAQWRGQGVLGTKSVAFVSLFAWGQAYAVVTHPGPAFGRTYPVRDGWLALLAGLAVTLALALLMGLLSRRRVILETQVQISEAQLSASQEQYRDLVEHANSIILRMDRHGRVTFFNTFAEEFFGYSRQDLIGQKLVGTIAPERESTGRDLQTLAQDILEHPEAYAVSENENMRRDGTRVWVSWTNRVVPDPDSGTAEILCIGQDITARRQAEAALRANEEKLRNIFRAAPTGIGMVIRRVIIEANDRMCEMTGYTREELVEKSARMLYSADEDFEYVGREKYRQIAEQGWGTVETQWRRKDGELMDVLLSSVASNPQDLDQGLTFTALDTTATRQAQQAQEKLEAQLRQAQKMESVGQLAGGVAHDFNNMLQTILGHTELLLDEPELPGAMQDGLREIEKAAQHSADLTRQLLAFARKQAISPQVLAINDTISGLLKILGRLIGEHIELVWRPGADLWSVRIDPAQVNQLLTNLVVNARDAIHGPGTITIATDNRELDPEFCDQHSEAMPGEYVALVVSDNGMGMPSHVLEHIFEPFFTTKDIGQGSGLGLATIYGIVKQNGGFIWASSTPGKGTRFELLLPRVAGAAVTPAQASAGGAPLTGQETILLVEDERALLNLGKTVLLRLGYNVLAAERPGEALRLARRHAGPIDLLLTDVMMPEMSGRELAAQVAQLKPEIKFLYMSGYAPELMPQQGMLEPGVQFLAKPFSVQALSEKVRQVLGS